MSRLILSFLALSLCLPLWADNRIHVEMPSMMREHMLGNMRDHLLALSQTQGLMAEQKWDEAAQLIESRLGMSSLESHGASHMAKVMPKEMAQLGTAMHRSASQLSRALQEEDWQKSVAGMSDLMSRCVACHAGYKVH